jgi:hypothetical protein
MTGIVGAIAFELSTQSGERALVQPRPLAAYPRPHPEDTDHFKIFEDLRGRLC